MIKKIILQYILYRSKKKTINVKQHGHLMIKFYLTNAYLADISAHSFLIKLDGDPPSIF